MAAIVAVAPVLAAGPTAASTVQPAGHSADGSYVASVHQTNAQSQVLLVYSAAMNKRIEIDVQRAADTSTPRPTLYLLNGAGGGEDDKTWKDKTDVLQYLATKDVNVVQPVGGRFSYYTDWRTPDPKLGVNKWRTFLTQELPPLIDKALNTNGVNAIAGLSMSGTSVLQLPIAAPGLYKSVAALRACLTWI
ncbi:hypothetical protein CRH09_26485 [Nocardia terpenica]|uniref:Esterase family protein n=2 Tax=Nocardia terpenica TaxID=455432 RepID=A0A291RPH0_9NOCA|nr:hypothetical protein CRH09_26485 [Nocardia terpenica]